jgi:hypothetical protein
MSNAAEDYYPYIQEEAVRELWYRGDLLWKLHSAQQVLHDAYQQAAGQLFVANCSRQFGKSFWAVILCIMTAFDKPNAQIRYGAAFQSDLVDYIIPAFEKVLTDCPEELKPKYHSSSKRFIFPNGSIIKLVGLDKNPNGLRGNALDLVVLDEAAFIHNLLYIYRSVIIPATTHRPNCRIVIISTPPNTPDHPFITFVEKADEQGAYKLFTVYENPLLDAEDIERLKRECGGESTTTWRREFLCECITDEDLAIIPEWKDEYIQEVPKDPFYEVYHKYIAMDLGVKDFTVALYGYYDFKRAELVIEDEFKLHGPSMTTEILAKKIRTEQERLWGGLPVYRRVCDNNWPLFVQDLSSLHSLTFISTSKDTLEIMINELKLLINAGRVLVHPKCKQLIGCLKYGVWSSNKRIFARSETYGHFDALAALIYLVRNLDKNVNPIPQDFGRVNHRSWLKNVRRGNHSHNAQVMESIFKPKK